MSPLPWIKVFLISKSRCPGLAVKGYHIETSEGAIGHLNDFIMDDKSWAICFLVVETGHWFSGKEIVISSKQIDSIPAGAGILRSSLEITG